MTLPYWIITFGASYFVFAMCVPHLHGLRWWSTASCFLVVIFMAIIFGVAIHDGKLQSSLHSHYARNLDAGLQVHSRLVYVPSLGLVTFRV